MTTSFLHSIAQAARLIQSGHADAAETMDWTTLESSLPADEEGEVDAAELQEHRPDADRSSAKDDKR
jgi:hypothetical protein